MLKRLGRPAWILVLGLHGLALLAPWLATHPVAWQDRERPFSPPTLPRFWTAEGWARPYVVPWQLGGDGKTWVPDPQNRRELVFLTRVDGKLRLVTTQPASACHFLGTDRFGRDLWSRVVTGAAASLWIGVVAAALAVALGTSLGGAAGFFGGKADLACRWLTELFLSLPWIYVLLGFRAFLPLSVPPQQVLATMVLLVGLFAWARPARQAQFLARVAREEGFALAARNLGASELQILRAHVWPRLLPQAAVQWAVLTPQCVLAEVTLSFLGLGASDAAPSLGSLVAAGGELRALAEAPWLLTPALVLVVAILSYHLLADEIQAQSPVG